MSLNNFVSRYINEHAEHEKERFYTLSGLIGRVFGVNRYWSFYSEREMAIARSSIAWIKHLVERVETTLDELSSYKLALQNMNSSLRQRRDFVIAATTAVSVLGLTDLKQSFAGYLDNPPKLFLIGISVIIGVALIEVARIQRKMELNERIVNLLDRFV
ncbi:hypothetical protein LZL12_21360 [Pseudomonas aeruginosa]|uniref:hypothetical protein n=1 Tax=Pseudomonas aeruginosa TaxID=287 RepID=UPI001067F505|nr:hypothetical protein [Pseudomonas aeruginosa]MBX5688240.1 hypothetical protein [Pseudomonas aeruginosa]MBX5791315.1 hypothetical protein [Pseudomonas aeruginosa]MCT5139964.1 hypothetical protein [Pseudomonas aeruginosa]MDP5666700.1 hypothetical protein [Pseudomonas aeruginosa]TEH59577.1 hypothetical protein IPC1318_23350 [Pseudomonas aeruginosa]